MNLEKQATRIERIGAMLVEHETRKLRLLQSIRFGVCLVWGGECASRSTGSLFNHLSAIALGFGGIIIMYCWTFEKPAGTSTP